MNSTVESHRTLALRPLTPKLGAALTDVKLADDMSDELFHAIYQAFLRYQVLLFPPQDVPPAAQAAFARQFGEVQVHVMSMYTRRLSRALSAVQSRRGRQAERQASGQGHARMAHRRLVATHHGTGNDHLRRDRPETGGETISATCTARTSA